MAVGIAAIIVGTVVASRVLVKKKNESSLPSGEENATDTEDKKDGE